MPSDLLPREAFSRWREPLAKLQSPFAGSLYESDGELIGCDSFALRSTGYKYLLLPIAATHRTFVSDNDARSATDLDEVSTSLLEGLIDGTGLGASMDEVSEFLRKNIELKPILDEATAKIWEYFGRRDIQIERRLFKDPDDAEDPGTLFLVVATRLPSSQTRQVMERLDEEWWLDQFYRTSGRLEITVEHRKS